MNAFGGKSYGWRKKNKRGVSPIIATILLVAITVVLAAVLYILISGLTHTGASTPYSMGMGAPSESVSGTPSTFYGEITISPQQGITTSNLGLTLKTGTGTSVQGATGSLPATCIATATYNATNCPVASTGWYALLYNLGTVKVVSVYTPGSNPASWSASTVAVTSSMGLVVVGAPALLGSSDTLNAFSLSGSSSISGSSGAF